MAKNQRVFKSKVTQDPSSITNLIYNQAAGAQKNTEVGRHLVALGDGSNGYTTDATTRRSLGEAGKNLAIYNTSSTLYAVTTGDSTVTALASGAVSGNFVGIPCQPNTWTYVACNEDKFVITQNAALLVFIIEDDTYIRQESSK